MTKTLRQSPNASLKEEVLKIKHLLPKNTRAIIYESYPEYNTAKGANLINNVLRGLTADQRLTGILKQIIANKL